MNTCRALHPGQTAGHLALLKTSAVWQGTRITYAKAHPSTTALLKANLDYSTTNAHSITKIVHATYKFLLLFRTILVYKDHSSFEHQRRKLETKATQSIRLGTGVLYTHSTQTFQLLRQPSPESGREGRSKPTSPLAILPPKPKLNCFQYTKPSYFIVA